MTIGGPRLRQHIVEFVRGVGVITDGVTDTSDPSSPWSWTVPDGVRQIFITGVGGGGGGSGGSNNATTSGGGSGGGAGVGVLNFAAPVRPNSVLTITVGQGGPGGTPSVVVANGETTSVAGLLFNPVGGNGTTLELFGGHNGGTTSVTGNGRTGGHCGVNAAGTRTPQLATGSGGSSASGAPGVGGGTADPFYENFYFYGQGGAGGGGANTTTSLAGGTGGGRNGPRWTPGSIFSTITTGGTGATNGTTLSQGGGGNGGDSLMGCGGQGGNGGVAGGNATGYGAGGGGGGGSASGGAGTDGYLAIVYWAAD